MRTSDRSATLPSSAPSFRYAPSTPQAGRWMPAREALLLVRYHLRLLGRWPFVLMALAYIACALLAWAQAQTGGATGRSIASELSRFAMEPLAGLFAGVLFSSVVAGDPALEVTLATPSGIQVVAAWRLLPVLPALAACSGAYLAWSLANGITYSSRQSALYMLLMWLAPVLLTGMLGLFGSLITRNAALGAAMAAFPLAGSLFLFGPLLSIQAAHPFLITYTYSGGQDAPDWWANRLTILGIATALALGSALLLRREERLLWSTR